MKGNSSHISDDLLVKYLVGEATSQEMAGVEAWLSESQANRLHYDHFRTIWEQSKQLAVQVSPNEDEAWERFRQMTGSVHYIRPPFYRHSWVRIAAALLLALGLGWMGYFFSGKAPGHIRVSIASGNATRTDTLPDGSIVILNKHSLLAHPQKFTGGTRPVSLTGEGFFSVAHDRNKPFIVQANDVEIKVTGTSFNIKMTKAGTEVIVETGAVQVTKNRHTVTLHPGEKVMASAGSDALRKEINTGSLHTYYRIRQFVCDRTPLWKLVQVLNEAYDADIVIGNPSLAGQPISTTFVNEPLDKILTIISETFSISVEKKGSRIILR